MIRLLWLLIVGKWPKSTRCGHVDYTRCVGVISPLCWDRRCRYHCGNYCQCEKADKRLGAVG